MTVRIAGGKRYRIPAAALPDSHHVASISFFLTFSEVDFGLTWAGQCIRVFGNGTPNGCLQSRGIELGNVIGADRRG